MATKINTFAITALTKGAHCDFHNRVNNLITATGADKLHVEALATQYAEAIAVEASIVNRETAFVATTTMMETDRQRDLLLSTINAVINAHQWNPIAAKKTAYTYLSALTAPYKGIRDHEYSRETSEVNGLIDVLSADDAAPHLTALGLIDELAALSSANAAFSAEFEKKMAEAADRAPQSDISTKEARHACDALYTQITDVVNAYALIMPSDEITQFITQLNGIVYTFDAIASQSSGSAKKEEEEEATPDTPTTDETPSTETI